MSYQDTLKLGMTRRQVIAALGDPDAIEKGEVFEEWSWEKVVDDDGKEYQAHISFADGLVSSLSFSTPGAPPVELVICI